MPACTHPHTPTPTHIHPHPHTITHTPVSTNTDTHTTHTRTHQSTNTDTHTTHTHVHINQSTCNTGTRAISVLNTQSLHKYHNLTAPAQAPTNLSITSTQHERTHEVLLCHLLQSVQLVLVRGLRVARQHIRAPGVTHRRLDLVSCGTHQLICRSESKLTAGLKDELVCNWVLTLAVNRLIDGHLRMNHTFQILLTTTKIQVTKSHVKSWLTVLDTLGVAWSFYARSTHNTANSKCNQVKNGQ